MNIKPLADRVLILLHLQKRNNWRYYHSVLQKKNL